MYKSLYHQLGQKKRDRIFLLKKKGMTNTEIALKLGRDKSTISRELRHNTHQKLHQYLRRAHRIRRKKNGRKHQKDSRIPIGLISRNGLVRFYLPKDTDLDRVTAVQIRQVEDKINNRPMKCLNYQTPNEVYAIEMNKLTINQNL